MLLLWSTLGVSVASALLPLVNVEAYLGVVATQVDASRAVPLAVVAGVGQALGKVAWYEAARRGSDSAWLERRLRRPAVRARYDDWRERAHGRPVLVTGVLLTSSLVGLPPLLVTAPLAGALGLSRVVFVVTVAVGRSTQFLVILLGVGRLLG